MTTATYTVEIDFDRDGTYGHASSDVTAYVLEMQWQNGMTSSEQEFANPAALRLTLSNNAGDFNPEDSGATFFGLFKKGLLIRIQANLASVDYTLYIGKIREIPEIEGAIYSSKQVQVSASGYMQDLLQAEFAPRFDEAITTDAALKQVFDDGILAFPYQSSYWILESSTASILDQTTILLDGSAAYSFEVGKQTLAYVGDVSGSENTIRAQQFCRDIVAAEMGGRFWYDTRNGKFLFHHRQRDINPTITVTLDGDDFEDFIYIDQGTVYNHATVHYYPRSIGTPLSVVWSSPTILSVPAKDTKTLTARYQDPDETNVKIAAKDYIMMVRGVDYIANRNADGSGVDETANVYVNAEFSAQSAKITLVNNKKRTVHFTTLQVRATPVKTFERQSITLTDTESITNYDPQYTTRTLKYVDDEEDVRDFAGTLIGQYGTPITRFESITFIGNKSGTRMAQALLRTIGDAVTLQFADVSHDKNYIIVGERHRIQAGGEHTHECTWILKPADNAIYWVLDETGYTELDETTRLAF